MHSMNQIKQRISFSAVRIACVIAIPALLTACATGPAPAKDIQTAPDGILSKDFTGAYVSPSLRAKLLAVELPEHKKYSEIKIKFNQYLKTIGDKEDRVAYPEYTFRPVEGNLFQEIRDISNNGFLATRTLVLSWAGLLTLRWDQASSDLQFSRAGFELKDFKPFKFNPAKMSVGDKFNYEYQFGNRPQAFNLNTAKVNCTVQKIAPAAEMNKSIDGKAVWFDCDTTFSAASPSRNKFVFLVDYGLALNTEFVTAERSNRFEVKEFLVK